VTLSLVDVFSPQEGKPRPIASAGVLFMSLEFASRVDGSIPSLATTFPASFRHFRGAESACRSFGMLRATSLLLGWH